MDSRSHFRHRGHGRDQVRAQTPQFVDRRVLKFDKPRVLREVALAVRDIEDSPALGRPTDRMRKALKNREAVLAPVTMPPQGCQRGSVRGVIGALLKRPS